MAHPKIEVMVDEALARTLLAQQHPDLADLPLTWVGTGWDNAMWRLGDHLLLRFPVREAAAHLVEHEQAWLPVLADRLPVAVPVPVRNGLPAHGFPWAWSVVPWFDAVTAATTPVDERGAWAPRLADFFVALHVPAPQDAPDNPVRGGDVAARRQPLHERLATLALPDADRIASRFDELAAAPAWRGPALWVHGDPHPANLLVHDGDLRAVIDFGDVTSGDPACDLATAWLTFDAPARARLRARVDAACGWDEAMWRRAQAWALHLAVAMQMHPVEYPHLAAVGRHGVEQALAT
ncbi:aminoglycoside phosphotransferase family protein [Cellulomonas edaphi]|uniref:Aminoglycoside phosphotransferase family protein n=1 Tax=Cellulomonas edaphi TaxID=3053468 RepID=A0ABT7S8V5_9CELL|nr:aminoglycoside phosphotransferase family protein [Cellulomons edaphi]MDM7831364.1 aminoglycoside phosphotransferase family protein [Cellulomons edaphi]